MVKRQTDRLFSTLILYSNFPFTAMQYHQQVNKTSDAPAALQHLQNVQKEQKNRISSFEVEEMSPSSDGEEEQTDNNIERLHVVGNDDALKSMTNFTHIKPNGIFNKIYELLSSMEGER